MIPEKKICILRDGKEEVVNMNDWFREIGVDSHIRIHESEYNNIDNKKKFFTHFNLESTPHKVGYRYALSKILKAGHEKKDEVVEPLLSYENIYFGECVEVGNNLDYKSLDPRIFEYSMTTIKDIDSLKQAILQRYGMSRPELSKEEILSKGVSYTTLKLI